VNTSSIPLEVFGAVAAQLRRRSFFLMGSATFPDPRTGGGLGHLVRPFSNRFPLIAIQQGLKG
jgi:hypothetical protein